MTCDGWAALRCLRRVGWRCSLLSARRRLCGSGGAPSNEAPSVDAARVLRTALLDELHQTFHVRAAARGREGSRTGSGLRSAARRASDRGWKMTDPQLPKGIWYHTDAQFIGFRVVRPLAVPSAEEMTRYWISGVEKD